MAYQIELPEKTNFCRVQDAQQAKLLSNQKSFAYFSPFLAQEQTVADAAEEANCSLETMLYHIKQFLNAGLIKIVREEKRAGRPLKIYRSSFDAYFIPFEATPFSSLEERLEHEFGEQQKTIIRSVARHLRYKDAMGYRFFRAPDGEVWQQCETNTSNHYDSDDPELPPGSQMYGHSYLTQEEARAYQIELNNLSHKYFKPYTKNRKTEGREAYVMNYTFVKLELE